MTAGGQIDQVGVEAVQGVQGQGGGGGVVPLIGEQGAAALQALHALQVTGPRRTAVALANAGPHHLGAGPCRGGNAQIVTVPDGYPIWSSPVPGPRTILTESPQKIIAIIEELGDMVTALRDADPEHKLEAYRTASRPTPNLHPGNANGARPNRSWATPLL
jgi:hypothetical protein